MAKTPEKEPIEKDETPKKVAFLEDARRKKALERVLERASKLDW